METHCTNQLVKKQLFKQHIDYAEFYVTNHCNITCKNCNRFNNHKISGSADWEQFCDTYKEWSKIITVKRIAFLGGEPLLHPNLHIMIGDVRSWWPASEIEITTNGLLIERIKPHLQQAIIDNSITVYVSIHKESWVEKIKQSVIEKFGALELIESKKVDPVGGHDVFKSHSGIKIILEYTYYFRPSALTYKDNLLVLHNSNPEAAHRICDMKYSFHFWKGCLYKCGVMVTLPYVVEQRKDLVNISQEQQDLLNRYKPLTLHRFKKDPWALDTLLNCIPQCSFCPSSYTGNQGKIFKD